MSRRRTTSYNFEEWNEWRERDGLLCRNDADCKWIDSSLYCKDYELDWAPSVSLHSNVP